MPADRMPTTETEDRQQMPMRILLLSSTISNNDTTPRPIDVQQHNCRSTGIHHLAIVV